MMRWAACMAAMLAAVGQAPPVKVLILTGHSDEPYHHWRETTAEIRKLLEETGRLTVEVNEAPGELKSLDGYDVALINYNGPRWTPATESAVEKFVRSGKGLAAFHLASYGEWFGMKFDGKWKAGPENGEWTAFPQMTGMRWAPEKIGHARRGAFTVDWASAEHPISRGLGKSFSADDELYHRITLAPGIRVLADAFSPPGMGGTGEREALIWVNRYGDGRVFYTTMGHDARAFQQPGLRTAFARGVEWAATGQVAR